MNARHSSLLGMKLLVFFSHGLLCYSQPILLGKMGFVMSCYKYNQREPILLASLGNFHGGVFVFNLAAYYGPCRLPVGAVLRRQTTCRFAVLLCLLCLVENFITL